MRKLFILSLLAMMIAIGGCGSGGTSADPLGTDTLMFGDATGSVVIQLNPNGAVALKATVTSASGAAVVGREVTFSIPINASGATLASYNANTNAVGEATILYRAGATAGSDVVRASISNGAKMDVNITVGTPTGAGNLISLTLTPATTSGTPLGTTTSSCIVQATVLRDDGVTPVANETVTFSIVTGGGIIAPLTVATNNSGIANAIFTAPGGATGFDAVVRAQILGTTNGGDAVGIIYW